MTKPDKLAKLDKYERKIAKHLPRAMAHAKTAKRVLRWMRKRDRLLLGVRDLGV